MQAKPNTFGKRGGPVQARPRLTVAAAQSSPGFAAPAAASPAAKPAEKDLEAIARSIIAETRREREVDQVVYGFVPTSWRAGILAGVAVSCMQAGLVVLKAKTGPLQVGPIELTGVSGSTAVAVQLVGSLWSGAEATASTVLFAHQILRRMRDTSLVTYTLAGGVVAGALAYLTMTLGGLKGEDALSGVLHSIGNAGPEHGWLVELATGAAAGFFYRLFAGARGKK